MLIRLGYSERALTLHFPCAGVYGDPGDHTKLDGGSAQVTLDWVLIRRMLR